MIWGSINIVETSAVEESVVKVRTLMMSVADELGSDLYPFNTAGKQCPGLTTHSHLTISEFTRQKHTERSALTSNRTLDCKMKEV